ncbi:MAG: hypothetical protein MI743_10800 [Sneathiellales bacterium]|nr:hypothetical protein [Sneathiellales bacterium]
MTSSPNKNSLIAPLFVAVAALAFPVATFAQEKPRSLVPQFIQDQTRNGEKAADDQKVSSPPAAQPLETPQSQQKGGGSLVIQTLDALSNSSIGTLGKEQGGFGSRLWEGSDPSLIANLISQLPVENRSMASQDLLRRLLLTSAQLPQKNEASEKILDLRFAILRKAGFSADVLDLAGRLPREGLNESRKTSIANAYLTLSDFEKFCSLVAEETGKGNANPFWTKSEAFCLVREKQFDKAELAVALLEEQGEEDPLFFTLFSALAGGVKPEKIENRNLTPLHLSMMNEAGVTPASDQDGAFYQSAFEKAKAAASPDMAASELAAIWETAEHKGEIGKLAQKSSEILTLVPPKNYDPAFNMNAVKMLLMVQQDETAKKWERVIRRAASQGTNTEKLQARKDVQRLDAYILLSGIDGIARWNSGSFASWMNAVQEDPAAGQKSTFLLSMLQALGYAVTEKDWEALLRRAVPLSTGQSNHALEVNLIAAAQKKRLGETILLSLLALGDAGPENVSTTSLVAVTTALRAVGLEREARQLALEAAVDLNL